MKLPNARNYCSGRFADWLEINITNKCNGRCSWCVEKGGFHPKYHAYWWKIANAAAETGAKKIIILGGEPMLYPHLQEVCYFLAQKGREVFITTNGVRLNKRSVHSLLKLAGINISIHHYDLQKNKEITGLTLNQKNLQEAIEVFRVYGVQVRMNCNCIKGYIDSKEEIEAYVRWAKNLGAHKVRFAELKFDDEHFVDLAKVMNFEHGLNDDPFNKGCNSDSVIEGMPVNFRQMCGWQTSRRTNPDDAVGTCNPVLYYDGKLYQGWQRADREVRMAGYISEKEKQVLDILKKVAEGTITPEQAKKLLEVHLTDDSGGECHY